MFDPKLGYDPEEWEECPESEHFLVFGFFTRFFLSAGAILFAYYFFKLVEANKNKGPREEEAEEGAPPATNDVLEEASRKLQSTTETRREVYRPPSSADALLQEADQYLKENIQTGRDISPRRFVDTELPRIEERPAVPPHREAEVAWEDVPRKYEDERRQVDEEVQFMHRQIENQMSGLHPVPHMQKPESVLSTGRDETWDSVATGSDFVFQPQAPLRRSLELPEGLNQPDLDAYVPTQQQQEVFHRPPLQVDTHVRPSGSPKLSPKMSPQRKLSGEELKALQEWEWELAKLEADRLAKLQDKEVGGEESEFSSSLAHLMPATHISYHTTTQPIGVTDQAVAGEMLQPERREPETTGRPA